MGVKAEGLYVFLFIPDAGTVKGVHPVGINAVGRYVSARVVPALSPGSYDMYPGGVGPVGYDISFVLGI